MEQLLEFDQKEFSTMAEGEELLLAHAALKNEMSEAYDNSTEEGKELLGALQKPVADDRSAKARSRISDYSEAVSHVMDVFLEMHEQNRQLTILWEKQRVRLSQRYKISEFKRDSSEVSCNVIQKLVFSARSADALSLLSVCTVRTARNLVLLAL